MNGGAPVKQWGAWLRADDLRYRSNSSLMGVKDLVKPGRETLGQTAAEPYGEGEGMSFPENQVQQKRQFGLKTIMQAWKMVSKG